MVAIESRYCPLFPIVAHVKIYMSLNCYTSVPTEPLSIDILLSAWLIFLFSSIERALSSSSFRTEKQKEILKLFEAFWWWFLGPVLNVNRNDTVKKNNCQYNGRMTKWLKIWHTSEAELRLWFSVSPKPETLLISSPSAACMRQWIGSALAQIMACRLFGECWLIVNWSHRNKLQWNLNRNTKLLIHKNAYENIVCEMAAILSRGRWVNDANFVVNGSTASCHIDTLWYYQWQESWNRGDYWFSVKRMEGSTLIFIRPSLGQICQNRPCVQKRNDSVKCFWVLAYAVYGRTDWLMGGRTDSAVP